MQAHTHPHTPPTPCVETHTANTESCLPAICYNGCSDTPPHTHPHLPQIIPKIVVSVHPETDTEQSNWNTCNPWETAVRVGGEGEGMMARVGVGGCSIYMTGFWGAVSIDIGVWCLQILGFDVNRFWGLMSTDFGVQCLQILGCDVNIFLGCRFWGVMSRDIGVWCQQILGCSVYRFWGVISIDFGVQC